MGIKRYFATKDTTITNAFKSNLTLRGTGSNMGASDILEVFSIYGQASTDATGSQELSRVLIQFPVTGTSAGEIKADRTAGDIPASGSVDFYLRLFNAKHSQTVPRDLIVNVMAVSQSWQEGTGLDMEEYKDATKDSIAGTNWINATSDSAQATLVDAINLSGIAAGDAFTMTVPSVTGGDGTAHQFKFDTGTNIDALSDTTGFGISTTSISDDGDCASVVVDAINGVANNKYQYGGANLGAGSTLGSATLGLTASIGSSATKVTLTMVTAGGAGNVTNILAANTGFEGALLLESTFTGGDGPWANVGGDYHSSSYTAGTTMPNYTFTFSKGSEDILLNVTSLVEEWIAGTHNNEGFGVFLTSSQEAYFSASAGTNSGSVLHNTDGAVKSYFTKKFFARGTQFFNKQPVIEARWDSSKKDDRGNFYYSSSLAAAADNLNTIYLYNYVKGQLKNIPSVGTGIIFVNIYSGSADNTAPAGSKLLLVKDGTYVTDSAKLVVSGGHVSTGIYSCSFAMTASSSPTGGFTKLYDVWYSGSVQYFTGSIVPKTRIASQVATQPNYITKVTNLKNKYTKDETPRLRVYVRERDSALSLYTVAKKTAQTTIIEDAYYKLIRAYDSEPIIEYGTGSANTDYSRLSFDISGNYFDLNMSTLEPGYAYGIKFAYYLDGDYKEQEDTFIFRIEEKP
jgi:hypothetical protein